MWFRIALSTSLVMGLILAWPDMFLFSKIVQLPDWVELFPNQWVAAWLLLIAPFSLALPGSSRFKPAATRIVAFAFFGSACGAGVQSHYRC
jgi:hypothetical protein